MKQTRMSEPGIQNGSGRNLTKKEITDRLQTKTGLPRQTVHEMVNFIFETFKEELIQGSTVKIANFGTWKTRDKKPRPGRNMRTGEPMEVSARSAVLFKPSKKLRVALNKRAPQESGS